jgi:hypothetical protein
MDTLTQREIKLLVFLLTMEMHYGHYHVASTREMSEIKALRDKIKKEVKQDVMPRM